MKVARRAAGQHRERCRALYLPNELLSTRRSKTSLIPYSSCWYFQPTLTPSSSSLKRGPAADSRWALKLHARALASHSVSSRSWSHFLGKRSFGCSYKVMTQQTPLWKSTLPKRRPTGPCLSRCIPLNELYCEMRRRLQAAAA